MVVKNTTAELEDNDVTSGGEPAADKVVADPGDAEGPNDAVAQPVQEAMSSGSSVPSEPVDDARRWELNYTPKYKIRREKFHNLAICWHLKQDEVDRRRRMGVLLRVALAVFEVQAVVNTSIADGDYLNKFVEWLDTYGDDKLLQDLKWALEESEWQPTGECVFEVSDLVLMRNTLTRDHAFYEPNVAEFVWRADPNPLYRAKHLAHAKTDKARADSALVAGMLAYTFYHTYCLTFLFVCS